jgi:adenosylcobinamide kinase/adenosylcobinamide-phosphate guanylyltransferase
MVCILILGGARSGKSLFAQKLAPRYGEDVLFVATASARDEEMRERIEKHRKARPKGWRTLEVTTGVGKGLTGSKSGVVILDCITLLVSNLIEERTPEAKVKREIHELIRAIDDYSTFIIVSNEVGTGLVPTSKTGRDYRDLLGWANQQLAKRADEVYLMVAGIPLRIKP